MIYQQRKITVSFTIKLPIDMLMLVGSGIFDNKVNIIKSYNTKQDAINGTISLIKSIKFLSHNIEHYTNIRNQCNYIMNNVNNENNITQNNINAIFVTTEPCSVLVLDR